MLFFRYPVFFFSVSSKYPSELQTIYYINRHLVIKRGSGYYLIITIVYNYHDYSMITMNPQGSTISTLNSSGSGLRLPRRAPARRCRGSRPCRAPRAPSGSNGRARRHPRGGVREFQWILWDFCGIFLGMLLGF